MSTAKPDLSSVALMDELGTDGPVAPPRSNGELTFAEPWESRAFGMMLALNDQGVFTLADFQAALITAVGAWEAKGEPNENYRYYECWLQALEQLVQEQTPVQITEVDRRANDFLTRPAGHDHDHDHGHGHDHHH